MKGFAPPSFLLKIFAPQSFLLKIFVSKSLSRDRAEFQIQGY